MVEPGELLNRTDRYLVSEPTPRVANVAAPRRHIHVDESTVDSGALHVAFHVAPAARAISTFSCKLCTLWRLDNSVHVREDTIHQRRGSDCVLAQARACRAGVSEEPQFQRAHDAPISPVGRF